MGDIKKEAQALDKAYREARFLYRGYMPSRQNGLYEFPSVWNGSAWVYIEDIASWEENTEQISEEKYQKVLAEMGGKDLS